MRRFGATLLALALAVLGTGRAEAAGAGSIIDRCTAQTCVATLTAQQLLTEVQKLVSDGRYAEAGPMLAALRNVPEMKFEWRFLSGYVAAQTGDLDRAASFYRAILTDDPKQTRVRLELARVMLLQGKNQSADRQFRLAQGDAELPPEIAQTIRAARDVIRSKRAWSLNVDAGIVPDSNINNATSADQINVYLGGQAVPLTLNQSAKPRSGVGLTASVDAGLRLPMSDKTMMLFDLNAIGTDYKGSAYDDYAGEVAVGPEFKLLDTTRVSAQAVVAERLYGGQVATRQAGLKSGLQTMLSGRTRLGVQIDVRRTFAAFDRDYSGWQIGSYATVERVVKKSLVASAGVFGRRDSLNAAAYSSTEGGVIAGLGGELPFGINAGVSATASRAVYDAPVYFFSERARRDWRYTGRLTLGVRALRVAGLSPAVTWSLARIDSSVDYYSTTRSRLRFTLARYF